MTNPNKYIRGAIVSALAPIKVWYKRVPKDADPGTAYVILSAQSKQPTEVSKTCWDWNCQVNLSLWVVGKQGFPPLTNMDDMEETVLNAMDTLSIDGWVLQDISLENQTDLSTETNALSIDQRVLTYNLWLDRRSV